MLDISEESRRRIAALVNSIMAAAEDPDVFDARRNQQAAATELLEAFMAGFTSNVTSISTGGRPRLPRQDLIQRLQEYLHSRNQEDLSVPGLAGRVGVSERTLRNIFQEFFEISPTRYIQILKLHRIRADLLRSRLSATVTTVASNHGVWDHGRLAQRYKLIFGESPSQTLAGVRGEAC